MPHLDTARETEAPEKQVIPSVLQEEGETEGRERRQRVREKRRPRAEGGERGVLSDLVSIRKEGLGCTIPAGSKPPPSHLHRIQEPLSLCLGLGQPALPLRTRRG